MHLDTLHTYLKACAELHTDVKVHVILVALVERLAAYGQRQQSLGQPPIPPHIPLFDIFSDQIGNIAQVICSIITLCCTSRCHFKIIVMKGAPGNAVGALSVSASLACKPGIPLLP